MPRFTSRTLGPNVPSSATRYFNRNIEAIDLTSEFNTSRFTDPIILEEDDDDDTITLDGDDDEENYRELTPREIERFKASLPQRAQLPRGCRELRSTKSSTDLEITAGMDVRLKDEDFFRVMRVFQDAERISRLAGQRLTRNRNIYYGISKTDGKPLHAVLPMPRNDLCMAVKRNIEGSEHDEYLEIISPDDVDVERKIIFTNQSWQAVSYYTEDNLCERTHTKQYIEDHGVLCCRWKYVEEIDLHAKKAKATGHQLVTLRDKECDKGRSIPDVVLRSAYGKQTTRESTTKSELVDLTFDDKPNRKRKYREDDEEFEISDRKLVYKRRSVNVVEESFARRGPRGNRHAPITTKYTVGDVCAGGGGSSRGAQMAGLELAWMLDHWPVAIATLRSNFPRSKHLCTSISDFIVDIYFNDDYTVDIMHISLPCQGHSLRNRNQNSEKAAENNIQVCCIADLLKKCRPRLVTLEQTNGILSTNEGMFFRRVLSQITSTGYSARWKVSKMYEQGVPAFRRRLFIVAACPGEKLPEWPIATHGHGPGQKPPVTFNKGIQNIPAWATLHDIEAQKRRKLRKLKVANGNEPLKQIINTGGIQVLHPEGYEPTFRQQMRLQTFPDHHTLTGRTRKDITTQIGNAVPCIYMEQLFRECKKTLEESDREAAAWKSEIISID